MKTKRLLYNILSKKAENDSVQILRVELNSHYTKVDIGICYQDAQKLEFQINPNIYIQSDLSTRKHVLLNEDSKPKIHQETHFKSQSDWMLISLYFEPIAFESTYMDVIENANRRSDFNFNKIPLTESYDLI